VSDLALIEACMGDIDFVQFMGIAKIGAQGQPFDERVLEKVRVFHARHPDVPIQVDGGVSVKNAKKLLSSGVSTLVMGSGILRAKDPAALIAEIEALPSPYGV
jgi:ribulose-phosphate 3-epimerase